jgi:hypothetical protein
MYNFGVSAPIDWRFFKEKMKIKLIALIGPTFLLSAHAAFAQTAYNNMTGDNNGYYINGDYEQSGSDVTNTDFQEFTLATPTPSYFEDVDLDLYNSNATSVDAAFIMGIWDDTGSGGGPGNELFTISSDYSLSPGLNTGFGFGGLHTVFGLDEVVPTDDNVWMSIVFTDNGGLDTNTTGAELDELSPATTAGYPTVGSTTGDDYFAYSDGDTNGNGYSFVPDPTVYYWDTGENFGANITTVPATPSTPGPAALLGFAAPALVALRRKSKRS